MLRRSARHLILHTPAKVNLFLEVLGKRDDGFHELETVMIAVSLYDTLQFAPADTIELHTRWANRGQPKLSAGPDNLIHRAAALLRETHGVKSGVRISLTKRIPLAAGLGGGSSDAAATLKALNIFWRLGLSSEELHRLAARLGSDVNFFLEDGPAVCTGRGERVQRIPSAKRLPMVIVRPPSGLGTAEVFRECSPTTTPRRADAIVRWLHARGQADCQGVLFNALQSPAERINDEVRRLSEAFAKLPVAGHLMSGSGSSCFAVCRSLRQARGIGSWLRNRRLGHVAVVQTLI